MSLLSLLNQQMISVPLSNNEFLLTNELLFILLIGAYINLSVNY